MYKTVRHGENSLQYTILPQTEEVLNNSGVKGKGRDYSPSIHVRRSKRRSTVNFVFLVIFCIIIALALAAVPVYIMHGALINWKHQPNHEATTTPPLASAGRDILKTRKKELKITADILSTLKSKLDMSTTTTSTTTPSTTIVSTRASEKLISSPWPVPALTPWKFSLLSTTIRPLPTEDNEIPLVGTPSGSIRMLDRYLTLKPWQKDGPTKPTGTPETTTMRDIFRLYYPKPRIESKKQEISTSNNIEAVITTKAPVTKPPMVIVSSTESSKFKDLKDTILSVDDEDEFKESLEVDEVFSLPPLNSGMETDEVKVSKAVDSSWYGARWPFVDTSSYFQWTGYSSGDNLLLPLLVAALSSVALVMLLAIALRRRKRSQSAATQIGGDDPQTDDNTNLLTAENPEDAEE